MDRVLKVFPGCMMFFISCLLIIPLKKSFEIFIEIANEPMSGFVAYVYILPIVLILFFIMIFGVFIGAGLICGEGSLWFFLASPFFFVYTKILFGEKIDGYIFTTTPWKQLNVAAAVLACAFLITAIISHFMLKRKT